MTRSSRKRKGKGKGMERGKGKVGGGGNCLDWTLKTRDTDWVIKWVLVHIPAQADLRF